MFRTILGLIILTLKSSAQNETRTKQIQVKDFDHFVDRTSAELNRKFFGGGELDQIWVRQLTSLSGEEWKDVRGAFTPIFTSGKMKNMMKFIHHVSKDLLNEFEKLSESKEEFELMKKEYEVEQDSGLGAPWNVLPLISI